MVAAKHFQDKPIVNSGRMSEQKLTLCIGNKIINSFTNDLRLISKSALNLVFKTTSNIKQNKLSNIFNDFISTVTQYRSSFSEVLRNVYAKASFTDFLKALQTF